MFAGFTQFRTVAKIKKIKKGIDIGLPLWYNERGRTRLRRGDCELFHKIVCYLTNEPVNFFTKKKIIKVVR